MDAIQRPRAGMGRMVSRTPSTTRLSAKTNSGDSPRYPSVTWGIGYKDGHACRGLFGKARTAGGTASIGEKERPRRWGFLRLNKQVQSFATHAAQILK